MKSLPPSGIQTENKKHQYWTESFQVDLIDRHFSDKGVEDVEILEDATEDGHPLRILCLKETDYVMKVMASWITLDELEGGNTKCNYKGRYGESIVTFFQISAAIWISLLLPYSGI